MIVERACVHCQVIHLEYLDFNYAWHHPTDVSFVQFSCKRNWLEVIWPGRLVIYYSLDN